MLKDQGELEKSKDSKNTGMNKAWPILFKDKSECCGCSACYAICPKNSIDMKEDEEGFLYPTVNTSLCIRCFLCISVCAFKMDQKEKSKEVPLVMQDSVC